MIGLRLPVEATLPPALRETPLRGLDRISLGVVAGQQFELGGAAVADDSASKAGEGQEVGTVAFVASGQAPESGHPLQGTLDDVAVAADSVG